MFIYIEDKIKEILSCNRSGVIQTLYSSATTVLKRLLLKTILNQRMAFQYEILFVPFDLVTRKLLQNEAPGGFAIGNKITQRQGESRV